MRALVTGVAGFIGSQLADALLEDGHEVVGLDVFTSAYPSRLKHNNVDELRPRPGFTFVEGDLVSAALEPHVEGVDVVFHLAAIPGVRASWQDGFRAYVENNVLGTQRLLEAAKDAGVRRVVYASSSSIYGNAERYPVEESDPLRPHSPYGVSKLAAENLCLAYFDAFGLDAVSLRYFSVYGPRQRPDMGVHRIVEAALTGGTFTIFGDGDQVRDMTFVGDVVDATLRAAQPDVPGGTTVNIAGGSQISLRELIDTVGRIAGSEVQVHKIPAQPGDVRRTDADTTAARHILGWTPTTPLNDGLAVQVEWHRRVAPRTMM